MSSALTLFLSFLAVIKPNLNAAFNSFGVRDSRRGWKDVNLWNCQVEGISLIILTQFLKPFKHTEV